MSADRLEPRRVQCALVGMLFDSAYAARVLGEGPLPELSPRERALLRTVDPRALATDPHRRARAVHALVDEYPVSTAVLGVAKVEGFFATAEFRAGVLEREAMAQTFARWLGDRARGAGRLEGAMVAVRRAGPRLASPSEARPEPLRAPLVRCPPGVRGVVVPEGTLAFHLRVREQLGPEPLEVLAQREGPWSERPPRRGTEFLLVERRPNGSIDLGTGSEPLVRLLRFTEGGRPRSEVETEAIRLGADAGDVRDVVDDLVGDGLLCVTIE